MLILNVGAAGSQAQDLAPPVLAPEDFSGCVGFYFISAQASPTRLHAEDPLILTVAIRGQGPERFQPRRERLHIFPADMGDHFYIDPLPARDRYSKADRTWVFAWELRPKNVAVHEVPSLKLVYWSLQRMFQSAYSDAVPLTVMPRPVLKLDTPKVQRPDTLLHIDTGPASLRRMSHAAWPPWWMLGTMVGAPAIACWLIRRFANRGVSADRCNHAAQNLLRQLGKHVDATTALARLTEYLRRRFGMEINEPIPAEVAAHLRRAGIDQALAQRAAGFCERCHEMRYASLGAFAGNELSPQLRELVTELERAVAAGRPRRRLWAMAALLGLGATQATDDEALLAKAAGLFEKQLYAEAADCFEELRRRGVHNPTHYANQGNAELLAGRLPAAILAYRRGLLLDPADSLLLANLEHARDQVAYDSAGLSRPPAHDWPPWAPVPDCSFLLAFAFVSYCCGLAGVAFANKYGGMARMLGVTGLISAIAAAAVYAGLQWRAELADKYPVVVIAAERTALRQGNGISYPAHPDLAELRRGVEARLLHKRGDWLQIQLASGIIGWVSEADVQPSAADLHIKPPR